MSDNARALLERLQAAYPPPPPTFATSKATYDLLLARVQEREPRATLWAQGLESLGAKIEIDEGVQYGQIVKRKVS